MCRKFFKWGLFLLLLFIAGCLFCATPAQNYPAIITLAQINPEPIPTTGWEIIGKIKYTVVNGQQHLQQPDAKIERSGDFFRVRNHVFKGRANMYVQALEYFEGNGGAVLTYVVAGKFEGLKKIE